MQERCGAGREGNPSAQAPPDHYHVIEGVDPEFTAFVILFTSDSWRQTVATFRGAREAAPDAWLQAAACGARHW